MQTTKNKKLYSDIPRKKTKREFVKEVFKTGSLKSYKDKQRSIVQCSRSKRRSVHDLWSICKTEYPSLTLKELGIYLKEIFKSNCDPRNNKKNKTFISYCPNIKKYTWFNNYGYYYPTSFLFFITTKENCKKYDSIIIGFSSDDLIKILK